MRVSFIQDWPEVATRICGRLIHPQVMEGHERERQLRLLGLLFAAPFLICAAIVQFLVGHWSTASIMAACSAVFGGSWMLALIVLLTGKRRLVEGAALALGILLIASVTLAAGGMASPVALTIGVPALEAYWVARSRRSLLVGGTAGLCAVLVAQSPLLSASGWVPAGAPSMGDWLLPVFYGATLLLRFGLLRQAEEDKAAPSEDLMQHMQAVVVKMNDSGDVSEVSPQVEKLLHVPAGVLLGTGLFDRIHVADRVGYLCVLSDARNGKSGQSADIRIRMPAGEGHGSAPFYQRFDMEFARISASGETLAILRDASARDALEHERDAACQRARQASFESKRLLAAASHELRTPLNAILGFADTLKSEVFGGFADERQREYVRLIHEAGEHLLSVVNTSLEVSQVGAGAFTPEPESFSFSEVLSASLALSGAEGVKKGVCVKVDAADDIGTVHCDRRALQQVLINLVSNALKFSPEHGEVAVSATRRRDRLDVAIRDRGVGMSEDALQRVGEPFVKIRTAETADLEGSGLGLALVKGLIEAQGGGLAIDSAPGCGTRVTFSLPVGAHDAAGGQEGARGAEATPVIENEWNDDEYRKTA